METLGILQEECAEIIQSISKYRRFGGNELSIEQEIGDAMCLILLLEKQGFISETGVELAVQRKLEKLRLYSNIV
jgi:NTP pyrophosphatase (non-canonical NTP hydrolase)